MAADLLGLLLIGLMLLVPVVGHAFGAFAGYLLLCFNVALGFWRFDRWCAKQYWSGLRDYQAWVAIWIRLPHVSSNTAVVTGPISAGSCVKRTPSARAARARRATSSTPNDVNGMPSSTSAP